MMAFTSSSYPSFTIEKYWPMPPRADRGVDASSGASASASDARDSLLDEDGMCTLAVVFDGGE